MAADASRAPAPHPAPSHGEEDTIVCRCEDLTLRDIREAIAEGAHTMDEIKRLTRCGMGPCQGKTCRQLLAAELARALKVPVANIALPTFRPTTKPVKLSLLLDDCGEAAVASAPHTAADTGREISL